MDWLTFFSKLVEALAWPVAVLLVVRMFKGQVLDRIPALKKLSAYGVEAEFEARLAKLESDPEQSDVSPPAPKPVPPIDTVAVRENPTGVIMEKWKEVEAAARAILAMNTGANRLLVLTMNSWQLRAELEKRGLLTNDEKAWFNELRVLRNIAAHEKLPIGEGAVNRYVDVADRFIRSMLQKSTITPPVVPSDTTAQP